MQVRETYKSSQKSSQNLFVIQEKFCIIIRYFHRFCIFNIKKTFPNLCWHSKYLKHLKSSFRKIEKCPNFYVLCLAILIFMLAIAKIETKEGYLELRWFTHLHPPCFGTGGGLGLGLTCVLLMHCTQFHIGALTLKVVVAESRSPPSLLLMLKL